MAALAVATISGVFVRRLPPSQAFDRKDAFNFDGSMPGDIAVDALWPDPRVRWTEFPMDGLMIVGPDTTIVAPPGSILMVPKPVGLDSTDVRETA